MENIFDCFERDKKASRELLAKYNTILPSALLDVWQEYGFGSLLGGYLKMINPDEYQALLHSSYVLSSTAITIFITAFADILTWEKDYLFALLSTRMVYLMVLPLALISFGAI